jgi:hypothetical protein
MDHIKNTVLLLLHESSFLQERAYGAVVQKWLFVCLFTCCIATAIPVVCFGVVA